MMRRMFSGLLFVVITGLLWMLIAIIMSRAVRKSLDPVAFLAISGTLASIGSWIVVADWDVLLAGNVPRLNELIIVIIAGGILGSAGSILMLQAMNAGHQAASWTISQSAMIIPFLWGTLVWQTPIVTTGWIGAGLIVLSVILLGRSKRHHEEGPVSPRWLIMVLSSFALMGVGQIFCSLPSQWLDWKDEAQLRVPLYQTMNAIPQVILALSLKRRVERRNLGIALVLAVLLAIVAQVSQVTIFRGLDRLGDANLLAIAYPLATGVCVVGFALYSGFVMKERFTSSTTGGVILGMAGLALLALNDLMKPGV